MQIAQVLAGYSLGGADLLRRAMGKKKPEEMAKQREVFQSGARNKGIDPDLAIRIFDLVEKFAGYGFNKSHSAAYALVSYQTAWLKAHYPAHFMAATMSSDMDKTDKVVTFIEECRNMKLNLLPPDVNSGEFQFTVDEAGNIIYGLGAIKGLGEGPVAAIIAARKGDKFKNIFDFCARVEASKVNKRALEALVRSGAFDKIGPGVDLDFDRALMFNLLNEAVKAAEQAHANANAGMMDMFGEVVPAGTTTDDVYAEYRNVRRWNMKERLNGERETLGLYLTGHPIDEYDKELSHLVSARIANLTADRNKQKVAGLVVAFRLMKTRRGDNMAFVTLDDRTGRVEVAVFADTFNQHRDILVKDALLVIEGQVSHDDYSGGLKMRADSITDLAQAREESLQALQIKLHSENTRDGYDEKLRNLLLRFKGESCAVRVRYQQREIGVDLQLAENWKVRPTEELVQALRSTFGPASVELVYRDQNTRTAAGAYSQVAAAAAVDAQFTPPWVH